MAGGNFFSDLFHATNLSRTMDEGRQRQLDLAARDNQRAALIKQYGDTSGGNVNDATALASDARSQQTQDMSVAADLRFRQTQAQRAGLGVARQILDLPPDQQDAAIQQYAPHIAAAFGTKPDEIVTTFHQLAQSSDPRGAIDALDQSLETPDERAARVQNEAAAARTEAENQNRLDVAGVAADSRENVANIRAGQNGTSTSAQSQAANAAVAGSLQSGLDLIDRTLMPYFQQQGNGHESIIGATGRNLFALAPGSTERGMADALGRIRSLVGLADLQNWRAHGVRFGNTTQREFDSLKDAVAALHFENGAGFTQQQLADARAALARFQRSFQYDVTHQANINANGEYVTPSASDAAPAGGAGGGGAGGAGSSQFQEGQVYRDARGNRARYHNGQWVPIQ